MMYHIIRLARILLLLIIVTKCVCCEKDDISIEAPPKEDEDSEFAMIPDENGGVYVVNVQEALEAPEAAFVPDTEIQYELYTKTNPNDPDFLKIDDVTVLKNSKFNAKNPTVILSHGWRSKGELSTLFQNAFFKESGRDINLISVNWQAGSSTLNYISARRRVPAVGIRVARLIDFMVKEGGLKLETLHLIGHSLGAHIVGIAGKNVKSGKIPRITGLDPASPLFSLKDPAGRLSDTDAKLVEIVHSNAGYLGFSTPLGRISFYLNGGRSQPGCGLDLFNICAHSRSYIYYAESIHNPTGFYAWKCESYDQMKKGKCHVNDLKDLIQMSADNHYNVSGVYYLETNKTPLFAIGRSVSLSRV